MKEKKVKSKKEKPAKTKKATKMREGKQTRSLKRLKKGMPKNGSFTRSLAFKMEVAVVVLLTVFFSALVVVLSLSIRRDNISSYSSLSSSIVDRSSAALTYWLNSYFKDLRVFTKNSIFLEGDIEKIREFMMTNRRLIGEDFDFVGVSDLDGNFYTTSGDVMQMRGTQAFKDIVERGLGMSITDPVVDSKHGTIFYAAVPAVDRNGILFGFFAGAVPVKIIANELSHIKVGETGYGFAVGSDGTVIAHPDQSIAMTPFAALEDSAAPIGFKEIVSEMLKWKPGSGFLHDKTSGRVEYAFFCPIKDTKWAIGFVIPEAEVLASARRNGLTIALCSFVIAVLLIIFIGIYMKILLRPLNHLKYSILEIASGDADLTKKLVIKSKDEIGGVVQGFNAFVENLRRIISEIKTSKEILHTVDANMQQTTLETAESISKIASNIDMVTAQIESQSESVDGTADVVTKIANNIEHLNRLIENQVSSVTQASSAIEQMLGNITSVSASTEKMATAFSKLEEYTQNGIQKQNAVNEQISQIEEQSMMLFTANKTISKIASETNLLAMNAAIEAAHAGWAGRGFSVVADEIRALSETSSKQSKTIGAELKRIQASIEAVVESSGEAKMAFNAVSENISQTDSLVRQIRGAMEESTRGSHQITDALRAMNESSAEVRTSSGEMSAGNQTILGEVQRLQEATQAMRESIEHMSSSAHQIDANGTTLSEISGTMQKSISQIGRQIDQFKV